jgi:hypothetical protein
LTGFELQVIDDDEVQEPAHESPEHDDEVPEIPVSQPVQPQAVVHVPFDFLQFHSPLGRKYKNHV